MAFKKASKRQAKLRMALVGPSGSGKTYSALAIAGGLAPNGRVAVIDTERGSASLYSDKFSFDVMELSSYAPETFVRAIREADAAGYDVLVIDSLSHAWAGAGGALEMADHAAARSKNSHAAWREVTPAHTELVDAILGAKAHVLVTLRVKTEWTYEEDDRGKKVPKKIGLAPVQRAGIEYEFTVVADMSQEHDMVISKTRCDLIADRVFKKPGAEFGATLAGWLNDGTPPPDISPLIAEGIRLVNETPFDGVAAAIKAHLDGAPAEFREEIREKLKGEYKRRAEAKATEQSNQQQTEVAK